MTSKTERDIIIYKQKVKYMKIRHLFLLLGIIAFQVTIAQNDTIWYNTSWNKTPKENAAYYRPSPQPEDGGYRVVDYYISGAKQMEGFSREKDRDVLDGTITWFTEDGKISQKAHYKNGSLEGEFTSYINGEEVARAVYKNNKIENGTSLVFREVYQFYLFRKYENGKQLKEIIFEKTLDKPRAEVTYGVGEHKQLYNVKHYDKNGIVTAEFTGNRDDRHNASFYNGKQIGYYYNPMQKKEEINYEDGKFKNYEIFYSSGKIRERAYVKNDTARITYFDKNGKELATLTSLFKPEQNISYIHSKPVEGTRIYFNHTSLSQDTQWITRTATYKNGRIIERKNFYENGKLKSRKAYEDGIMIRKEAYAENGTTNTELVYKNGNPFNGTDNSAQGHTVYRDGMVVEETTTYKSGAIFKKETDSTATFYDKNGEKLGELVYRINEHGRKKPYNGTLFQQRYGSDKLSTAESYKDGTLIKRTRFYREGTGTENIREKETFYDKTKRKTQVKSYYNNGQLRTDTKYKNSYTKEKATYYDKTGKLLSTMTFIPERHGIEYAFFSGSNRIESIKTYNEEGELIYEKKYEKDYRSRDNTGEYPIFLKKEIDYDGKAVFYNSNNALVAEATYKNGKPWEGKTVWGSSYSYTISSYKNGKKEGDEIKYKTPGNSTPSIKSKKTYLNGVLHGTSFTYFDNGQTESIKNYKNGLLDGEAIYYNENGTERNKLVYKKGSPYEGLSIDKRVASRNSTITKKSFYKAGKLTRKETRENDQLLQEASYTENGLQATEYNTSGVKTVVYNITDMENKSGEVIYYDENGAQKEKGSIIEGEPAEGVFYLKKFHISYARSLPDEKTKTIKLKVTKEKYTVLGFDEKMEEVFRISESKKLPELYLLNNVVRPDYFYNDFIGNL